MRDFFTFADIVIKLQIWILSLLFCYFEFIYCNVPQAETIRICADALYSSEHSPALFFWHIFVELMEMDTSSVKFWFGDIVQRQNRGFAMRSPLGLALVYIFVSFDESKLQITFKP